MPELHQETNPEKSEKVPPSITKAPKKVKSKPDSHSPVIANCPYCNTRHDVPIEKGKNGKPFFMRCSKCKNEFAVRFVQITIYKAEVAGFC